MQRGEAGVVPRFATGSSLFTFADTAKNCRASLGLDGRGARPSTCKNKSRQLPLMAEPRALAKARETPNYRALSEPPLTMLSVRLALDCLGRHRR